MTKSELTRLVADRLPHLSHRAAVMIVDSLFEGMSEALANGDRVEIRGFGSFRVNQHSDRQGRNPRTGEVVNIPPRKIPSFKVGKELYERLNRGGE